MINTETNYRWFIFYQDQLLLEKNDNAFSIPTGKNAPVTIPEGITVHTITTATGMVCKAFYTDSPIAETPEYVQIGLRASYDYLSPEHYQAAGKVHEILYWDRSNRFCPTCGTPLVQKEPIMKKCPNCGREIYPVISTAILVLVRKEDSLLLVHARNFKGTFNSLVAGFLETGENTGRMCSPRSERGNRTGREEYHLFRQPALALPQRINGRIHCRLCRRRNQIARRGIKLR